MLLNLKEVALQLSCSYTTARKLVKYGELPAIFLGERKIRVHQDTLDAFIEERKQEAIKLCQLQRTKKQGATNVVSMIQREGNTM